MAEPKSLLSSLESFDPVAQVSQERSIERENILRRKKAAEFLLVREAEYDNLEREKSKDGVKRGLVTNDEVEARVAEKFPLLYQETLDNPFALEGVARQKSIRENPNYLQRRNLNKDFQRDLILDHQGLSEGAKRGIRILGAVGDIGSDLIPATAASKALFNSTEVFSDPNANIQDKVKTVIGEGLRLATSRLALKTIGEFGKLPGMGKRALLGGVVGTGDQLSREFREGQNFDLSAAGRVLMAGGTGVVATPILEGAVMGLSKLFRNKAIQKSAQELVSKVDEAIPEQKLAQAVPEGQFSTEAVQAIPEQRLMQKADDILPEQKLVQKVDDVAAQMDDMTRTRKQLLGEVVPEQNLTQAIPEQRLAQAVPEQRIAQESIPPGIQANMADTRIKKSDVRLATGQRTLDERLVPESTALREVIKAEARGAKLGARETSIKNDLVNAISESMKKSSFKNIDLRSTERIQEMLSKEVPNLSADFVMSAKQKRNNFMARLAQGESIDTIEETLFVNLKKSDLKKMTTEQLADLANKIKTERIKGAQFLKQRRAVDAESEALANSAINKIKTSKDVDRASRVIKSAEMTETGLGKNMARGISNAKGNTVLGGQTPEGVIESIGGDIDLFNPGKNALDQGVYQPMFDGHRTKTEFYEKYVDKPFKDAVQNKQLTKDFFRVDNIDGLRIDSNARANIYMWAKDPDQYENMIKNNGIKQETIDKVIDSIKPSEREFLESLSSKMQKEVFPQYQKALYENGNKPIGYREWFWPVQTKGGPSKLDAHESLKFLGVDKADFDLGHSFSRVPKHNRKLDINAPAYQNYMNDVGTYIAFAQPRFRAMQVLNKVLPDIEEKFGKEVPKNIKQWMQDAIFGSRGPSDWAEEVGRFVRTRSYPAILGWNPKVALIQPISFLNAADEVGGKWAWKAAKDFSKNPMKAFREVMEESTILRNRSYNAALDDFKKEATLGRISGAMKSFNEFGTLPLKITDNAATIPTYMAAKAKWLAARPGDLKGAINYAERVVTRYAPMGNDFFRPSYLRGGEFSRGLFSFFSQRLQIFTKATQDYIKWRAGSISTPQYAKRLALQLVIPSAAMAAIYEGFKGEKGSIGGVGSGTLSNMVGIVPFLAQFASAIEFGKDSIIFPGQIPVQYAIKTVQGLKGAKQALDAGDQEIFNQKLQKAAFNGLLSFASLQGISYRPIKKMAELWADLTPEQQETKYKSMFDSNNPFKTFDKYSMLTKDTGTDTNSYLKKSGFITGVTKAKKKRTRIRKVKKGQKNQPIQFF